jgi:hypothetical protein
MIEELAAFAEGAHPSKHANTPNHNESAVATIDFEFKTRMRMQSITALDVPQSHG